MIPRTTFSPSFRCVLAAASTAFLLSCASASVRLSPPRPAAEIRLEDIESLAAKDPAAAIHLAEAFRLRYGPDEAASRIASAQVAAAAALREAAEKAAAERRWADAASLARSIGALGEGGSLSEGLPGEGVLLLEDARGKAAAGNAVAAFLSAAASHVLSPLPAEDALRFLSMAEAAGQRGNAAFFLRAAEAAGAAVPASSREFAFGSDSAGLMTRGVATVLVDKGIKLEKGRGSADMVIGSAFFIDASGLLVTNHHVIESLVDPKYEGYARLYVRLGDASSPRVPAKVVGWDRLMDLAVISASVEPGYVFSVLDRASLKVGDRVLAIGSPAGLEKTVTAGIVSAFGRRFLQLGEVVQIDAAVNHGNSGGPVVDSEGRLAGVVFAGISQFQGLNFAVPSDRLAAALPALLAGGKAERPWLGAVLHEAGGAVELVYTVPLSPAADLAFPEGAALASVGGTATPPEAGGSAVVAFQDALFARRPGELVRVEFGDGTARVAALAPRPEVPMAEAYHVDTRERLAAPLFGLVLDAAGTGLIGPAFTVRKVLRGSAADEAGFSEGDPVSITGLRVDEDAGFALMDVFVKRRRMGYLEATLRMPAALEIPDTL